MRSSDDFGSRRAAVDPDAFWQQRVSKESNLVKFQGVKMKNKDSFRSATVIKTPVMSDIVSVRLRLNIILYL